MYFWHTVKTSVSTETYQNFLGIALSFFKSFSVWSKSRLMFFRFPLLKNIFCDIYVVRIYEFESDNLLHPGRIHRDQGYKKSILLL